MILSIVALCSRNVPVIHLASSHVRVQRGETIELSAIVRRVPTNRQVIWSKNGHIIGQGSLSTTGDRRVHVYRSSERYYLKIEDARPQDAGSYKITLEGVKCASNEVKCSHENMCILKTAKCNGIRDCKDGSDELNCTVLIKPALRSNHPFNSRSTVRCPDGLIPEYSL
uniref:Ig-like domain-containing protein n=1 Tax=Parascaris equorum TaxID=6256 RepID=A0A914RJT2_PAREQ